VLYGELNQSAREDEYQQRALSAQKQLADSWPENPEYRQRLALLYNNRGQTYQKRGLWDKAEQQFLEAIKLGEHLAEAHAGALDYAIFLAGSYVDLGDLLLMAGKPQAALPWYAKAADRVQPLVKQNSKDLRANYQLIRMHGGTARSLSHLGRHAEALQIWDQAIPLATGAAQDDLYLARAVTLARMGRPEQAAAEAERLLKKDSSDWTSYYAARIFAVSATAPGLASQRAEQHAAHAVELLRKAVASDLQARQDMKTEKDFDFLRERADFKGLLIDLEKQTPGTARER
jgi:tetratricopeptide (TPR) repeat protein